MKARRFVVTLFLLLAAAGCGWGAQDAVFDATFIDRTMRIDYFHTGDAEQELAALDRVYEQGIWAGSRLRLTDRFDNGRYCAKVYDAANGALIFSKGFDSYFGEYKTTAQALKGVKRTYHESVLIPYPKKPVRFELEVRDRKNVLHSFFSQEIDPESVSIVKEKLIPRVQVLTIIENGDPQAKVDIAIVAEGYSIAEEDKLRRDLERAAGVLLSQEPYKSFHQRFNVLGVFLPSAESGCDEPRHGLYRNTALGATFNSLGSERYLLTEDNRMLRDIAAHVPYDALVIMVNHKRYGGGGIYNLYCTFTTDNQWHAYLFLHEFGHSFTGLADEYYTSSVAYNEFYPQGVEPVEANITALVDPESLKWKNLVSRDVELPSPWEKADFDRMDMDYQKVRQEVNERIAKLKREGAPSAEVEKAEEESERLSLEHAEKMDAYLAASRFRGKVGAFEGAGYSSRGLYRPMVDCLMFTKGRKPYCRVCEQAIIRVIKHYTE